MSARVLDGRPLAAAIREGVASRAAAFAERTGRRPQLVAVLVGDDPANLAYARAKGRAAERLGLAFACLALPAEAGTDRVVSEIRRLNADDAVDGILVELPLPPGCDAPAIQATIDPARDVDGVTPDSLGRLVAGRPGPRPATPLAVMALLEAEAVALAGARATVVGRSTVVGKPLALLLLAAHATVTIAHSRTRDLARVTRDADVLVSAAGVPGLITAAHVRPGSVVIDVGTSTVGSGDEERLVGDVDFAAVAPLAGAITPVPGGVAPVTTATALRTTLELAEWRAGV
jgi:methylenetetrahydrofolate dehydrogenase (NADP+)/methenyltetrahydrofolate cyclohydrolase